MTVGIDYLAQRCGEYLRVWERLLDFIYHTLEAIDFVGQVSSARFRPFYPQAELEVFLVADEDVRNSCNFREDIVQLFLST